MSNALPGIDQVAPKVTEHKPDVLVSFIHTPQDPVLSRSCDGIGFLDQVHHVWLHNEFILTRTPQFSASMWSAEQAAEIQGIARSIRPDIKLHAIPQGLQVEKGPDAIVEYLIENVPALLDGEN